MNSLSIKRFFSIFLSILVAVSTFPVIANAKNAPDNYVKSISVAKKATITIPAEKKTISKTFKVNVKVSGKVSKKFTAKSSKKSVAAVKISGDKIKVTAKKSGKAIIAVTTKAKNKKGKKLSKKLTVTVKKKKPDKREKYLLFKLKESISQRAEFYDSRSDSNVVVAGVEYPYSFVLINSGANAVYNLGGNYKRLCFTVGYHQSINKYAEASDVYYNDGVDYSLSGSLLVYGDGKLLGEYKLSNHSAPQEVKLSVSGVKKLKFVTGNTEAYHIAVASPTIWKSSEPTDVFSNPEKLTSKKSLISKTYLFDHDGINYIYDGKHTSLFYGKDLYSFKMTNTNFTKGFVSSPSGDDKPSSVYFNLRKSCKSVGFWLGHNDEYPYDYPCKLELFADGVKLFERVLKPDMLKEYICVDADYAQILEFRFSDTDKGLHTGCYGIGNLCGSATKLSESEKTPEVKDAQLLISQVNEPYLYPDALIEGWGGKVYSGDKKEYMVMGSDKYYEGFVLNPSVSILSNRDSYACFNIYGAYSKLTFTAGHIDGSNMKPYTLKVLGDGEIIEEIPLDPYALPKDYTVDVTGVKSLQFRIDAVQEVYHGFYGIANPMLYKGEVTEHNLIIKDERDYPQQVNLLTLTDPYAFRCQNTSDSDYYTALGEESSVYYKGTNSTKVFAAGESEHNQGFMLEANEHFDIESVNFDALVFTAFAFFAGNGGYFKGYAAFNLHGEYSTLTFKVSPYGDNCKDQTLLIGTDNDTAEEIRLKADEGEKTVTVNLNNCKRLGFVLGGDNEDDFWSGRYAFYDLILTK